MTDKQAKEQGYTHKAFMYGINGYIKFDGEGMEFTAKYILLDYLHECIVHLDSVVGFSPYGFCAKVGEQL